MSLPKDKKNLVKKAIFIASFLLIFTVLLILKQNRSICEWYQRHILVGYQYAVGYITKYLPFSLFEFIISFFVVLAVIFLVRVFINLKPKKRLESLKNLLNLGLLVSFVLTIFTATAEMGYNREEVPINYYQEDVDKSQFSSIITYFIEDLNEIASTLEYNDDGSLKEKYSTKELSDLANKEVARLNGNPYFSSFTTNCKPMISSFVFTEFHITGVETLSTVEANINTHNPASSKPMTFVHELIHLKGVMREEDTQKTALALCLSSENPLFRYSAYMFSLGYLFNIVTGEEYRSLASLICREYFSNASSNQKFWDEHNLWAEIGDWWNNLYLKTSGESRGTEAYGDTPTIITPTKIYFTDYQKIYFRVYFKGEMFISK